MDIIKLRNATLDAIDRSSIKAENNEECFCVSIAYDRFELMEILEVNFYMDSDKYTVFYTFRHDYSKEDITVERRYQTENSRTGIVYSKAINELSNNFEKMGVKFDGKYL